MKRIDGSEHQKSSGMIRIAIQEMAENDQKNQKTFRIIP